ncbi:MAG: adenine deaminase C-terminal domain-containing protein, partial [Phycisphaerae bacterium]
QVREGSSARNLDTFLPLLAENRLGDWCLATDDIHVDDLMDHGNLDSMLRRVVAAGVPAARAVRHAALVPARHYGLSDRGAVAPGYRADLFVTKDWTEFEPHVAIKNGELVAREGRFEGTIERVEAASENTVRVGGMDESAFVLRIEGEECPVIGLVPDNIVTKRAVRRVRREEGTGRWLFDPEHDVAKVACIERHHATGRVGVGLVAGFGFRRPGALGSSVAHDAHNLVVAGTDASNMLACTRALEECGGGLVAVSDGSVLANLPLPVAGLVSDLDYETVRRDLDRVTEAARSLGCQLAAPFGTLSFLCLSVIPELRITDRGLFDVSRQSLVRA